METSTGRRLFWAGFGGLAIGGSCSVATALFATGGSCSDRQLAAALLAWSPLLSMVPALLTSSRKIGDVAAATLTGVLAILMGAINATAVWTTTQLLAGDTQLHDLGAVVVLSLPFGGIPGAGYTVPLALGTLFTRQMLEAPRGAIGAGRRLLLTVAIIAVATSGLLVAAERVEYSLWPAILAFDAALAAVCLAVAAREIGWALRLRRIAQDTSGNYEVVATDPAAMPASLPHVVGRAGPVETGVVYRLEEQQALPYRNARTRVPLLGLEASPAAAARVLFRGALMLLVCAALLAFTASQMPQLAPQSPLASCSLPF